MMEIISGKKFSSNEIDQIIRMIDADKDGVVSFQDFREKIWNLRWFIEPAQAAKIATTTIAPAQSMEEVKSMKVTCDNNTRHHFGESIGQRPDVAKELNFSYRRRCSG